MPANDHDLLNGLLSLTDDEIELSIDFELLSARKNLTAEVLKDKIKSVDFGILAKLAHNSEDFESLFKSPALDDFWLDDYCREKNIEPNLSSQWPNIHDFDLLRGKLLYEKSKELQEDEKREAVQTEENSAVESPKQARFSAPRANENHSPNFKERSPKKQSQVDFSPQVRALLVEANRLGYFRASKKLVLHDLTRVNDHTSPNKVWQIRDMAEETVKHSSTPGYLLVSKVCLNLAQLNKSALGDAKHDPRKHEQRKQLVNDYYARHLQAFRAAQVQIPHCTAAMMNAFGTTDFRKVAKYYDWTDVQKGLLRESARNLNLYQQGHALSTGELFSEMFRGLQLSEQQEKPSSRAVLFS